jgi:hypothetical protein
VRIPPGPARAATAPSRSAALASSTPPQASQIRKATVLRGAVPVETADIGVLAGEPVGEALLGEEVQGAIHRDRRHAPAGAAEPLGDLVGAQGPVGGVESLENLAADRRQADPVGPAEVLGLSQRPFGAFGLPFRMGAGRCPMDEKGEGGSGHNHASASRTTLFV